MKAIRSSETLVVIRTTRRHIPEDGIFQRALVQHGLEPPLQVGSMQDEGTEGGRGGGGLPSLIHSLTMCFLDSDRYEQTHPLQIWRTTLTPLQCKRRHHESTSHASTAAVLALPMTGTTCTARSPEAPANGHTTPCNALKVNRRFGAELSPPFSGPKNETELRFTCHLLSRRCLDLLIALP
jgi:hypothetical protein